MQIYRVPVEESFSWQRPVLDKDLSSPPANPAKGDRYIVGPSPIGAWTGRSNNIAWWNGSAWKFDIPADGWVCYVRDENLLYVYEDTSWVELVPSPGGQTQVKHAIIDFGPLPLAEKEFTIVDADITPDSKIIAQVAYEAPPDKDLDELEMDDLLLKCKAEQGRFKLFIRSADGSYLHDKFIINYI